MRSRKLSFLLAGTSSLFQGTAHAHTNTTMVVLTPSSSPGRGKRISLPAALLVAGGFMVPMSRSGSAGFMRPMSDSSAGLHEKRVRPRMSVPQPARKPNWLKPRKSLTMSTKNEPLVTTADTMAGRPALMMASRMAMSYGLPAPSSSLVRKTKWMPKSMPNPIRMPPRMLVIMLSSPTVA